MSEDFVRQNTADQDKRLDADKLERAGLEIFRLRTTPAPMVVLVDETIPTSIYIGEALPGSTTAQAVWRIRKVLTVGAQKGIVFADGNADYDNVWDNRQSLTYLPNF